MGGGREHAVERGQTGADEVGDLLKAAALHEEQQVEAAGHQEHGFHLREAADARRDAVEPALALGTDTQLDDRPHVGGLKAVGVEHRLKAADHAVLLVGGDTRSDVLFRGGEFLRERRVGLPCVLFQQIE